jgi:hypothetical protein
MFLIPPIGVKCNIYGFVKSPYAVLPFFPPHCDVPSVRLIRRDSGALPMELFTLPFEKVLNWPFYDFINIEGGLTGELGVVPENRTRDPVSRG